MSTLAALTARLSVGEHLARAEAGVAAAALAAADDTDEAKGEFLTALAKKGETPEELAAFATAFRARAVNPGVEAWSDRAIDIVGTGGDHSGGFNISSMVVLVLASAGVVVMKHGNRGITSKCGSADLLAGLGVNLEAPPETLRRALDELGFVFFFAPAYHPAFKHIAPVRKALFQQRVADVTLFVARHAEDEPVHPGRPQRLIGPEQPDPFGRLNDGRILIDLRFFHSTLLRHPAMGLHYSE